MLRQILFIALLISLAVLTYALFYPGAVFVLAILIEAVLYAGAALTLFFWRKKSRWWIPVLCIFGAMFLLLTTLGCLKLAESLRWINQNPDFYPDGKIVEGSAGGMASLDIAITERNTYVTPGLTFRAGEKGISRGGGLILRLGKIIPVGGKPRFYDCTYQDMFSNTLQVNNPAGQGFVSVRAPAGIKLSLSQPDAPNTRDFLLNAFVTACGPYRNDLSSPIYYQLNAAHRHEVHLKLTAGNLRPGEAVELILGDRSGGGPGWMMPAGEADADLVIYADESGSGEYRVVPSYVTLEVGGGQAASLEVISPSTPGLNEEFTFVVKAVDNDGFLSLKYSGTISLPRQDGIEFDQSTYTFLAADKGAARLKARVTKAGTYNLSLRDAATGKAYSSNTLMVGETAGTHIYWGDLHQHTTLGKDANRVPEWVFQRNRDIEGFDFAAISIHDLFEYWGLPPDPDELSYLKEVTEKYNDSGKFVTFHGYEWTNLPQGHRNIYFAGGEAPVLFPYDKVKSPDALRTELAGQHYIAIPHHTAWRFMYSNSPYNWGPLDWEEARLAEIYSKHGSSDFFEGPFPIHHDVTPFFIYLMGATSNRAHKGDGSYVREALAKGYKLGITAGGDNHWARGGKSFGTGITQDYPHGLQAVVATDLTRAGLYEAMWQRHTYGTTGARIIIDFKVNGSPMGSEISADNGGLPLIYYMVKGTAPVQSIEIWKYSKSKGYEVFNFAGKGMLDAEGQFSDNEFDQDAFYFMKVVQEDGNLAWSSPVWLQKLAAGQLPGLADDTGYSDPGYEQDPALLDNLYMCGQAVSNKLDDRRLLELLISRDLQGSCTGGTF